MGSKAIIILLFSTSILFSGCLGIDSAISNYEAISGSIKLGDSKKDVWNKLESAATNLASHYRKPPEQFFQEGKLVEIFFARTG